MTRITGLSPCRNVGNRLCDRVGSCESTIVAGEAVTCGHWPCSRSMIHRCRRKNRETVVTGTALSRRWNMSRRLGLCVHVLVTTTMTCRAVCQTGMIHCCRTERNEILVAIRTLCGCRNMRRRHADGRAIVMTPRTIDICRVMSPGGSRPANR